MTELLEDLFLTFAHKSRSAVLTVLVFLWGEALSGGRRVSPAAIGKAVGQSPAYVRRVLTLLEDLDLVRRTKYAIALRAAHTPGLRASLQMIRSGELRLNLRQGVILKHTQTGRVVSQSDPQNDTGLSPNDTGVSFSVSELDSGVVFGDDVGRMLYNARAVIINNTKLTSNKNIGLTSNKNVSTKDLITSSDVLVSSKNPFSAPTSGDLGSGSLVPPPPSSGDPPPDVASIVAATLKAEADVKKAAKRARAEANKPSPEVEAQIEKIYQAWKYFMDFPDRKLTRSHSRSRWHVIHARLKEGYTYAQFEGVIRWAANEPFFRGQNDRNTPYDDIGNLFGSAEKFDRYLLRAGGTLGRGNHDPRLFASDDETQGREF